MSTILFFKSQIAGYTRRDGTYVRPHSDRRTKKPSKAFGSVVVLAKRAYEGLSPQAKNAVDSWNVNWHTGQLEQAFQVGSDLAKEVEHAFKPVREKLRSIYGDTVPLYRGEKAGGADSSPGRKLFSWSPLFKLAQNFAANSIRGIPAPIADEAIQRAVEQYERTGFVSFGGKKFKRNKEMPEYYDIYDRDNNMITDGDDLAEDLRSSKEYRNEMIAEMKAKGDVYAAEVPIDDLVWIPLGANLSQPEIIARYNPRQQPSSVMAKAVLFLRPMSAPPAAA
jgi:hypothetical protein